MVEICTWRFTYEKGTKGSDLRSAAKAAAFAHRKKGIRPDVSDGDAQSIGNGLARFRPLAIAPNGGGDGLLGESNGRAHILGEQAPEDQLRTDQAGRP